MPTLEDVISAVTTVDPSAYDDWRNTGSGLEYTVHAGSGSPNGWHATMHEAWEAYALQLKASAEESERISDAAIDTLSAALHLEPSE